MFQTYHQKDIFTIQTIDLEKSNATYLILNMIWTQMNLQTIVNN